jgi:hypothetical protein
LSGLKDAAEMELPTCMKCGEGRLVPLSDYGTEGASVTYKAWACINPTCGFQLRIDKGQVTYGRKLEPVPS